MIFDSATYTCTYPKSNYINSTDFMCYGIIIIIFNIIACDITC